MKYDGIDYVIQENIGLNFDGFQSVQDGLDKMCVKVGSYRHAEVYKIHGLEQSEWILLENDAMLSPADPHGGIYRSSKVRMDTIADFKPDYLVVDYLTPPTSERSGTAIQVLDTADSEVIERIVTAIENGKTIPAEKQEEVAKVMLTGDSSYRCYRLEFSSTSFPKLVYRLDCAEDADGKLYIGYYGDVTAHRIIEIDNGVRHQLMMSAGIQVY